MTSLITNILNAHNKNNIYDNYNNSVKIVIQSITT